MLRQAAPGASPGAAAHIVDAMSVDVEDWFQVAAFERVIPPGDWERLPCRVEANVERILELFGAAGVRATFFTLGWIAHRHPGVVRAIVAGGHELASHGWGHQRVATLDRAAFREDVARAKGLLEDLGGVAVGGYRAPSFSIGPATPWAHEVLLETGHRYSSSVYPVRRDLYGSPDAPRFAWRHPSGLLEIPPSTVATAGRNLPASGGGFFRLLPYAVSRGLIRRVHARDAQPALFYFHPWEIDAGQPRVTGAPVRSRVRHYLNLRRTMPRLQRLLADFHWDRTDRVFAAALEARP